MKIIQTRIVFVSTNGIILQNTGGDRNRPSFVGLHESHPSRHYSSISLSLFDKFWLLTGKVRATARK